MTAYQRLPLRATCPFMGVVSFRLRVGPAVGRRIGRSAIAASRDERGVVGTQPLARASFSVELDGGFAASVDAAAQRQGEVTTCARIEHADLGLGAENLLMLSRKAHAGGAYEGGPDRDRLAVRVDDHEHLLGHDRGPVRRDGDVSRRTDPPGARALLDGRRARGVPAPGVWSALGPGRRHPQLIAQRPGCYSLRPICRMKLTRS